MPTYDTLQAKITRTKVDLLIFEMDYCSNTYGSAPCTASGPAATKCFNTFPTCQDKPNFTKTTKQYKFINAGLPLRVVNKYYGARPYLKSYNELPTEIKEKDTVVKRLKVDLFDEPDNDFGIDPYVTGRTSTQGTYWKKWIARNTNYKGRTIKLYEGFEGLAEGDFQLHFVGTIDNITLNNGIMQFEAVDLLKKLSDIDYPLKTTISTEFAVGNVFEAVSQTAMLELNAERLDYCIRRDYAVISFTALPGNGGSGALAAGTYSINLIYYDAVDRPFAESSGNAVVTGSGNGYIDLSWVDPSNTDYVRVYAKISTGNWQLLGVILAGVQATTINSLIGGSEQDPPSQAEIWFALNGDDPTDIANWDEFHTTMTIDVTASTNLETAGYLKLDDEIIYYTWDGVTTVLGNIARGQFNTSYARHTSGSLVFLLLYETPQNPFQLLQDILTLGGIDAAYHDSKFTTYEAAWTDIDFSTMPIAKSTKLNKIYFDLVNALDCMSWVGEDGKIKILKHSEVGTVPALTDEANIIFGSLSIDENESSRYTQWWQYYNRFNPEKDIDDKEAYNRAVQSIDAVAESANEYNDEIEDTQYSTWLNVLGNTEAELITYVTALLVLRKNRTRDAQRILNFDVELKDGALQTGDLIDVTTAKVQDTYGNSAAHRYRIIKKTPKVNQFGVVNKFGLKCIRVLT